MDSSYYQIYSSLYDRYSQYYDGRRTLITPPFGRSNEARLMAALTRTIDRYNLDTDPPFVRSSGIYLRPDASYFLLVNFHQMIIRPIVERLLSKRYKEPFRLDITELEDDLQQDVVTILNASNSNIREGVSGHEIINVINRLWPELRTTRFEIWG